MPSGFSKYRLVYSHLWSTYGQSWYVRFAFLLRFFMRICQLVFLPILLSLIIGRLSRRDFAGAQQAVWLFAGVSLLVGLVQLLSRYIGLLGENAAYRLITGNYFSRLVSADLDYFNSSLAGYLTTATRQYVDACNTFVRSLRDRYMNTVLSIILPLVVIFWVDIWLGVVTLLLSLIQMAYLFWASNAITPYREKSVEVYKHNSGRMADIVSNILAVKSTAQEDASVHAVRGGAAREASVLKQRGAVQTRLFALRELITVLFFLVLLWLVVQRMKGGFIAITAAVLVVTYTSTIMTAVYSLSEELDNHDDNIDKITPAFEVLNRQHAINDPAKPKEFKRAHGAIAFKDVSFSYGTGKERRQVFKDLSLTIPAGQKVGVVGLSGAGKSTLARLLLRFNDVDSGQVTIDGVDVRDVRQADLHRQIAYVPQEPLLFHTTILENVRFARSDASDKEVRDALRAAHALTFVDQLQDGIDTVVGERGVKLSGGQRQRIAIARAVLQHSPIMVLDEATSALDSESEQIIKDSFASVFRGKTALVIAHRLSTLSDMDRIIVLEKGGIVEDGSHAELVAAKGTYARLWNRQLRHLEDA